MRVMIGLIFAALIGWCVWWFIGSTSQKTAWENWFQDRKNAGWVAENSSIDVRGFPSRFDTTISDFQLADTQSGWAWSAPFFQILMLSYKPNHVIAVWPDEQKISGPHDTIKVTSDNMRGSVVFVPNTDLTLDSTQIEIKGLGLLGSSWTAGLESANFATRRVEAGNAPDFAHQIGIDAVNLTLSEPLKNSLDPAGILPPTIERGHLDVTTAFDAPWDRHSIEGQKPQLTAISVKDISLTWGELNLQANGLLSIDSRGYPNGSIKLKARNWQEMLKLAAASGLISKDLARTVEDGLRFLSALGSDNNTLNLPLTFSNGIIKLGPIPVGSAPRLAIP